MLMWILKVQEEKKINKILDYFMLASCMEINHSNS